MGDVALTIRLTRQEYEGLREVAEAEGRALEDVGADAVRRSLPIEPTRTGRDQSPGAPDYDPLLEIADGLGEGGPPDLADRHDEYLERARRECRPSSQTPGPGVRRE